MGLLGLFDKNLDDYFFALVFGLGGLVLTGIAFEHGYWIIGLVLLGITVFLEYLCLEV